MGKSKRKTKLSSVRSKSWPIVGSIDTTLEIIGDDLLTEIKSKLVSGKPSERHLAADMISSSLANVDNYSDKELTELVRILSPICLDRVENCRNAAIDSLWYLWDNHLFWSNNWSNIMDNSYLSSMSDKVCDLMVGADVMTPLIAVFNNFFGDGFDWSQKKKSELISNIYVNSCRLLTNLWSVHSFDLILGILFSINLIVFSAVPQKRRQNSSIIQIWAIF